MAESSGTSTGLQENVAGLLCYVLGWVTGIVFLILEANNKTIRFHAFQSILVFAILTVIDIAFGWIFILGPLIWAVTFIVWILLIVMAAQGKKYKLPWAGNLAEKWAG
jgi:uncharacterized membrane protein